MSRKLTALLLAMLVLVGAMGLKAVVASHSNGDVLMANGPEPFPQPPARFNGPEPFPQPPVRSNSLVSFPQSLAAR